VQRALGGATTRLAQAPPAAESWGATRSAVCREGIGDATADIAYGAAVRARAGPGPRAPLDE